jgi:hypothetical protein
VSVYFSYKKSICHGVVRCHHGNLSYKMLEYVMKYCVGYAVIGYYAVIS